MTFEGLAVAVGDFLWLLRFTPLAQMAFLSC